MPKSHSQRPTDDFASERPRVSERESRALDVVAGGHETGSASAKDAFARKHGFTSYLELFEGSSVVRSVDGKNWCITALSGNKWMLWNEQDLKAHSTHASLDEATRAIAEH
jgi:hypothetical protein